jgi:hypothetical protein
MLAAVITVLGTRLVVPVLVAVDPVDPVRRAENDR